MIDVEILNRRSIYFRLSSNHGNDFIKKLYDFLNKKEITLALKESFLNLGGKKIRNIDLKIVEDGEYYSVKEGTLYLEFEQEMAHEFLLFFERALTRGRFETPEVMNFWSKDGKGPTITIYGEVIS